MLILLLYMQKLFPPQQKWETFQKLCLDKTIFTDALQIQLHAPSIFYLSNAWF